MTGLPELRGFGRASHFPKSQSGHVVDSDARPPSQLTKGESGPLAPHFRGETCLNRAPER